MAEVTIADFKPRLDCFLDDVLAGLSLPDKQLPPKYFYDEPGSLLFERITELPEYYPTRTEIGIMESHIGEIADTLGPNCLLVEYGSGSSLKTRLLLDALDDPAAYVPIDISREMLLESAIALQRDYPDLEVLPVCADFTQPYTLPAPRRTPRKIVWYFPGSTIGNFHPEAAVALLRQMAELGGLGGSLLIGVDLKKDRTTLERAYDDAAGVTAAFNRNLLERMQRELRADLDLDGFQHRACYDEAIGRVEMHLVSRCEQTIAIGPYLFPFEAGEHLLTECSYKYDLDGFADLAGEAGFVRRKVWIDPKQWFSVQLFEVS